jgi:hypothetical protein
LASGVLARSADFFGGAERALGDARRTLSFLRGRVEFRSREDDVYVVSYPRSGTTWMQLMLHLLAGRDQLDFSHISEVSPWFERSLAVGSMCADDFEGFPSPRIFKSHLPHGWLPRAGRYVYLWRDGRDVAVSYFHLYCSLLGFDQDFQAFFQRFLRGELQYRSWFDHVAGWMARATDPRVLIVRYEDLRQDRAAVLRRVAAHAGMSVSEEHLARVVATSTFEAMKAQESKYDHATALRLERGHAAQPFLRRGVCGEGLAALDANQQAAFEQRLRAMSQGPSRELRLPAFLH